MTRFASLHRIFITLIFALTLAAHAQVVGGTITGTVRDASGATISGATVTVHQLETGATRKLTTDDEGRFLLLRCPWVNTLSHRRTTGSRLNSRAESHSPSVKVCP